MTSTWDVSRALASEPSETTVSASTGIRWYHAATPTVTPVDYHGDPRFYALLQELARLHSDKNHDYAKGGKPTGNFDRVAAILALYPNLKLSDPRVVALVYALKQLDAVLWGLSENITHKVEGLNDRLQDISVYSKIVMCMNHDLQP